METITVHITRNFFIILTTKLEIKLLEIGLAFCTLLKMLRKEQTTNEFYKFIRQLKSHEHFYENPNKAFPEILTTLYEIENVIH